MNVEIELPKLIELSRAGDGQALGDLLERFRGYLSNLAADRLRGRAASRVTASDVVQQTFLEAHRDFRQFAGSAEPELAVWLARMLDRNAADALRQHLRAQKRALAREQPLGAADSSGPNPANSISAGISTPSQQAVRGEEEAWLAQAISRLPPDQQQAIRLRYMEGRSLADIAEQMSRSLTAAAGLVKRGLQGLNKVRHDSHE